MSFKHGIWLKTAAVVAKSHECHHDNTSDADASQWRDAAVSTGYLATRGACIVIV